MSAIAAQHSRHIAFADRPNFRRVFGMFRVTFVTRKPLFTAFEFDGDDVNLAVVVRTPGLLINVRPIYLYVMNCHRLKEICFGFCLFNTDKNNFVSVL